MGTGAPRSLEDDDQPVRELPPEVSALVTRALAKLDATRPEFKVARDEERDAQLSKLWVGLCREIDGHLRTLARVLIEGHQLSLDMGSDGGGRGTRPWMEETTGAFGRLVLRLDDSEVVAAVGETEVLRGPVGRLSYEWVEEAVVNWVLHEAEGRAGRTP